jgi:hypothetical protein
VGEVGHSDVAAQPPRQERHGTSSQLP